MYLVHAFWRRLPLVRKFLIRRFWPLPGIEDSVIIYFINMNIYFYMSREGVKKTGGKDWLFAWVGLSFAELLLHLPLIIFQNRSKHVTGDQGKREKDRRPPAQTAHNRYLSSGQGLGLQWACQRVKVPAQ